MNKKVQEYIEKLRMLEKPEILSMTKPQIPSVLLMKDAQVFIEKSQTIYFGRETYLCYW